MSYMLLFRLSVGVIVTAIYMGESDIYSEEEHTGRDIGNYIVH
jgi:hypothetical protein